MKIFRALKRLFRRKEVVHFISRLPVCMELSEQDKSRLYGLPETEEKDE